MKKLFGLIVPLMFIGSIATGELQVYASNEADFAPQDIVKDNAMYSLERKLEKSPDSFEAWVKMPSTLKDDVWGGIIFGNYFSSQGTVGMTNFKVDKQGKFRIFWNRTTSYNAEVDYTFQNYDLRNDQWTHIALVRNQLEGSFTYYVNGEVNEKIYIASSPAVANQTYGIGCDKQCWAYNSYQENGYKRPFQGQIKQVTVYNGPITHSKIKEDMRAEEVLPSSRFDLIGSWNLNNWTKSVVEDTSTYDNDALFNHYEKYIDVEETENYDYSFIAFPDTQITNHYHKDVFDLDYDWIVDNAKAKNIQYVTHVGDLCDASSIPEWENVRRNYDKLLDNDIRIGFAPGNHDYDDGGGRSRPITKYNTYLPYEKWSKLPYFGGAMYEGDLANYYNLIEVDGVKYLFMNLEFGQRDCTIQWANRVVEAYPDHRIIVSLHHFTEQDGTIADASSAHISTRYGIGKGNSCNDPYQLYDKFIRKHANMFMVLSGHVSFDDILHGTKIGDHGNTIHHILIDAQGSLSRTKYGFSDVFALFKINEGEKKIYTYWYSPQQDKYLNIQSQFVFDFADPYNPAIGARE